MPPSSDAPDLARPGEPSVAGSQEFFENTHRAFLTARAASGAVEREYVIGNCGVRFSFAGPALVPSLTPALSHLAAPLAGPADLEVCLWDTESTDVNPPAPPWSADDYFGNGNIRGFGHAGLRGAFDVYLGMLSLIDLPGRRAIFWLRKSSHLPITLMGTPLRVIFQWWQGSHGRQLVHAAAVGHAQGALLFAGMSGAGKSTTAMVALTSGLDFLGDDFVLVDSEPVPTVFSLYNSAKLARQAIEGRFPEIVPDPPERFHLNEPKEIFFVAERWPDRIATSLPIRALLVPRITGRAGTTVQPLQPGPALRVLLPGLFPFPGVRQFSLERLGDLVRRVPSYLLELGTETAGVAEALQRLLTANR